VTFSDSRIVKLLQDEFIPVWESVSPVREVTFDLGEGRSVSGTVGGEIAIYFCTPEGYVFDILPALQSPVATKQAMEEALAFYKTSQAKLTNDSINSWHLQRMRNYLHQLSINDPDRFIGIARKLTSRNDEHDKQSVSSVTERSPSVGTEAITRATLDEILQSPSPTFESQLFEKSKAGEQRRDQYIESAMDEATRDMRVMAMSKVVLSSERESITVVEPGGRGYFMWQVHRAFLGIPPSSRAPGSSLTVYPAIWENRLKTPDAWTEPLFVHILKQPLKGGKVTYDSESLEAISIIEER